MTHVRFNLTLTCTAVEFREQSCIHATAILTRIPDGYGVIPALYLLLFLVIARIVREMRVETCFSLMRRWSDILDPVSVLLRFFHLHT